MEFLPLIAALAIFCLAVIALYVVLVRMFGPRRRLETALGMEALRARLTSGEITREEFDEAKRTLGA